MESRKQAARRPSPPFPRAASLSCTGSNAVNGPQLAALRSFASVHQTVCKAAEQQLCLPIITTARMPYRQQGPGGVTQANRLHLPASDSGP